MKISPLKTRIITDGCKTEDIVFEYCPEIKEGSILAITSKIVAVCEGNTRSTMEKNKLSLVRQEADLYLDEEESPYSLTIKDNILIPAAGIDESNSNGRYILWPKDSYASARRIRDMIADKYNLKDFGVIITDSKTTPLRWGTTGISIGHCGFHALKDYRKTADIFGRPMQVTVSNQVDGLAASAVLIMGEGNERTPMALIEDVSFIKFDCKSPTIQEINQLKIDMDDDIYASLLNSVTWKKGK